MAKSKRGRRGDEEETVTGFSDGKRRRGGVDLFDALPDELVLSILSKLSASARCPSDFINVLLTYVALFPQPFFFSSSFFPLPIDHIISCVFHSFLSGQVQETEGVRPQFSGSVQGVV